MSMDRIEKNIILRAPRSRVWRALSTVEEFSAWFGLTFEGAFVPGARVTAWIPVEGGEPVAMEMTVEEVEPEQRLSFRWHPYPLDRNVNYAEEPTTLVEFQLADTAEGTHLTVVESGFDRIPPVRRINAFRMNDHGWTEQVGNIARYVAT